MSRLRHQDLEVLLTFVADVYRLGDLSTFRQRMVRSLGTLVRSDHVIYAEIDVRQGTFAGLSEPSDVLGSVPLERYARLVAQSPLMKCYSRGKGSAVKISDFVTQPELRRTELYNDGFRPLGIEYQIAKGLPGPPGLVTSVTLARRRVDFDERDRLVLNLLRPHLNQGYRNAAALGRMRRDLLLVERGLDASSSGIVTLAPDGRPRSMTTRAAQWLAAYFDDGRRPSRALPEPVARWLAGQRADAGRIDRPRASLRVDRARATLVIRYVADGEDGVLLLEEIRHEPDPAALATLGLTLREAEVLGWIAEGKTNGEIAVILGTRVRTIDKHVEHIREKLGVETRTAAVARARALRG